MTIDRCYCFDTTFAALAEVAEATGAETVAELQEHATFGQKCQLCRPYTRRMLRTGQTVFHQIVTEADEPAASHGQPGAGASQPAPAPGSAPAPRRQGPSGALSEPA